MHPGGRPPRFETTDQLASTIETYFEQFDTVKAAKEKRKTLINERGPTITGLCLYCGFDSRQSFYDYGRKAEFSYTIKRARLRIECHYESMLFSNHPTGAIFALKSFGWRDDQNINLNDERERVASLFPEELKSIGEDKEPFDKQIAASRAATESNSGN